MDMSIFRASAIATLLCATGCGREIPKPETVVVWPPAYGQDVQHVVSSNQQDSLVITTTYFDIHLNMNPEDVTVMRRTHTLRHRPTVPNNLAETLTALGASRSTRLRVGAVDGDTWQNYLAVSNALRQVGFTNISIYRPEK